MPPQCRTRRCPDPTDERICANHLGAFPRWSPAARREESPPECFPNAASAPLRFAPTAGSPAGDWCAAVAVGCCCCCGGVAAPSCSRRRSDCSLARAAFSRRSAAREGLAGPGAGAPPEPLEPDSRPRDGGVAAREGSPPDPSEVRRDDREVPEEYPAVSVGEWAARKAPPAAAAEAAAGVVTAPVVGEGPQGVWKAEGGGDGRPQGG